jgi:pimeloyl-ACP methyl ester carboxylesterase
MSTTTFSAPSLRVHREKVWFRSGTDRCAAWFYRGGNGAVVVMAGGFGVPKEPATDRFAAAFHAAGFSVLAFDYRRLGESEGGPRQVVRIDDQLADWDAAVAYAGRLPDVDRSKVALWGFSLSGGYVLAVAARHPEVAAAIAQTPVADGRAATRNAARHQTISGLMRFADVALLDLFGSLVGRKPRLIPLAGPRGTVAVLTTPDALDGDRALVPADEAADWPQVVAARSALRLGSYCPGRRARRIECPLLVVACRDDQSALAAPAIKVAERAPQAELVVLPGGHYAPFLDAHDDAVAAEVAFLRTHVVER